MIGLPFALEALQVTVIDPMPTLALERLGALGRPAGTKTICTPVTYVVPYRASISAV
ncbi:MAG: hypothetical protein RIS09_175 [Actinomycetota bacterium]